MENPTVIIAATDGDSNREPAKKLKTPARIIAFFTFQAAATAAWICTLGWSALKLIEWFLT
jgi:hypothetical protein